MATARLQTPLPAPTVGIKGVAGDRNKDSKDVARIVVAALEEAGFTGHFTVRVTNKLPASGCAKPHIDFKNFEASGVMAKVRCGTSNDTFYVCAISSDNPNLRPQQLFEALVRAFPDKTFEYAETKPAAKEIATVIPMLSQQSPTASKTASQPAIAQVSTARIGERIAELRERVQRHEEAVRIRDKCDEMIAADQTEIEEIDRQIHSLIELKQGVESRLAQTRVDRRNMEAVVGDPAFAEAAAKLQLAEEGLQNLLAAIG